MLRSPNLDIETQLTALLKGESIFPTINNIITYDFFEETKITYGISFIKLAIRPNPLAMKREMR